MVSGKHYNEFIELAAHDLDSPLRKISLLSERILAKTARSGDEELERYLTRMQASLSDMRTMVDHLSLLARLGYQAPQVEACDIQKIVDAAVSELEPGEGGEKPVINAEDLPVIQGDFSQYKQLFFQLIRNAVKFKTAGTTSNVTISSTLLDNQQKMKFSLPAELPYYKISISDNGIGFKNEDAERIFIPFVRLNGKSEYPGSGIGLALCKKIVENHRGIIYAEGNERTGATITLILPQSPQ